jgi:hypothetical protein
MYWPFVGVLALFDDLRESSRELSQLGKDGRRWNLSLIYSQRSLRNHHWWMMA